MTRAPYWDVLGIDPTPDEAIVRRAYASKLRVTNPEDDADGFKRLREAYEFAMGHARYLQMHPPVDSPSEVAGDGDDDGDGANAAVEEPRTVVIPPAPPTPGVAHAPPETATLDPLEQERRNHDALCQKLMTALQGNGTPTERLEAFKAILKSPAMQQLDVYSATEGWAIHVLISMRPASNPLFDPAIDFFRWEDQRVGDRNGGAQHIVHLRQRVDQEQDAERLLARFKDKRHEFHLAWKETTRPPSERNWLDRQLSRRHLGRVTEFLEYLSQRSPVALESLNPEAVSWWWKGRAKRRNPQAVQTRNGRMISVMVMLAFFLGLPAIVNFAKQNPAVREPVLMVRPPPPSAHREPGTRALLDLMPAEATDAERRYAARKDCREATKRLGKVPPGVKTFTTSEADVRCKKVLEMTPDSLLMRQYAGIVALRLGEAEVALEHFTTILGKSPDDAYALFGKGLVETIAAEDSGLGKVKDMSDALAMNPDVAAYFADFGIEAPGVEPSARKPRSRLPKLEPVRAQTDAEKLDNPDEANGQALSEHFGLDSTTSGEVVLQCIVNTKGRAVNCLIKSETPANVGLGEVGLLAMKDIRYKPPMTDGEPVGGMPLTYTLSYTVTAANTPREGR